MRFRLKADYFAPTCQDPITINYNGCAARSQGANLSVNASNLKSRFCSKRSFWADERELSGRLTHVPGDATDCANVAASSRCIDLTQTAALMAEPKYNSEFLDHISEANFPFNSSFLMQLADQIPIYLSGKAEWRWAEFSVLTIHRHVRRFFLLQMSSYFRRRKVISMPRSRKSA